MVLAYELLFISFVILGFFQSTCCDFQSSNSILVSQRVEGKLFLWSVLYFIMLFFGSKFCAVLNCRHFLNVQVLWSSFDKLELGSGEIRQVLLLTYANGFQVWDVQDASNVHELVSRRDGPVAFLRLQPKPILQEPMDEGVNFEGARPLLLVVTVDVTGSGSPGAGGGGGSLNFGASHFVPTVVRFYSLRNHSYVHSLRFRTGIHAVRCSPRVVAVALATQVIEFLTL